MDNIKRIKEIGGPGQETRAVEPSDTKKPAVEVYQPLDELKVPAEGEKGAGKELITSKEVDQRVAVSVEPDNKVAVLEPREVESGSDGKISAKDLENVIGSSL